MNDELNDRTEQETHDIVEGARPAATLILVRERQDALPEVLMVERSSKMRFAAGAAVFPGGGVDADDFDHALRLPESQNLAHLDAACRIAAIRETLEEAGLAYAISGLSSGVEIKNARKRLHNGELFSDICADYSWTPMIEALVPWARWCPPSDIKRGYDTRFYIADGTRISAQGWIDETETQHLFWDSADDVLRKAAEEDGPALVFPTKRNLERLAQYRSFGDLRAHAEAHPVRLIQTSLIERDGITYMRLADGHGYPFLEEELSKAMRG